MEQYGRIAHEKRLTRTLLIAAAAVLFFGLFAQIAVRAQVSGQTKEISAVQAGINAMKVDAENLQLCINQHHNLEEISKRALAMGMEQLTDDRIRVVSLPAGNSTSTQTVANIDGEEISG